MPEGHVIHRAARDHRPLLVGRGPLAASSPQGRFAAGAILLDGHACEAIDAHGKHLLYRFAHGPTLHLHLGLYGRFRVQPTPAAPPRGAVRVRLAAAAHVLDVIGPNTCEVLDRAGVAALLARVGPDPLRADADPAPAFRRVAASRAPVGLLLMDQSVIAGIGNIYRTEILWRQRVHPKTPGRALDRPTLERLWSDARALLELGVRLGAIVTVDGARPSRARYGTRVNIFAKPTCPACAGPVRAFALAARRVFACETCQGRPG